MPIQPSVIVYVGLINLNERKGVRSSCIGEIHNEEIEGK